MALDNVFELAAGDGDEEWAPDDPSGWPKPTNETEKNHGKQHGK